MAVFHTITKLVKNGVLMIIHIYAKVSPSLKPIKTIPLWGGGIYPQLTRQRDEFYPHLYGDYPHPWIFY
jgi:hypothetical protein